MINCLLKARSVIHDLCSMLERSKVSKAGFKSWDDWKVSADKEFLAGRGSQMLNASASLLCLASTDANRPRAAGEADAVAGSAPPAVYARFSVPQMI